MFRPRRSDDPRAAAVRRLRGHFARHNRLVFFAGLLTLLVAAALWYLLYALLFWLALIFATLAHGMDAQAPEVLPVLFIYSAGLLILLTWLAHRRSPNDTPKDEKSAVEIGADILLAVPRATLAVWGNLSAWQSLNDAELALAAEFLARLERERRVPIYNVPLDLPDPGIRLRVLLALQLTDLIRIHHHDDGAWLSPSPTQEIALRE